MFAGWRFCEWQRHDGSVGAALSAQHGTENRTVIQRYQNYKPRLLPEYATTIIPHSFGRLAYPGTYYYFVARYNVAIQIICEIKSFFSRLSLHYFQVKVLHSIM